MDEIKNINLENKRKIESDNELYENIIKIQKNQSDLIEF